MRGLADRIRYALANPLRDDHAIDPMRELVDLLREVGLEPESGGGAVTFAGRDPIISSPLPFATMAAVALMSVTVTSSWRCSTPITMSAASCRSMSMTPRSADRWRCCCGLARRLRARRC